MRALTLLSCLLSAAALAQGTSAPGAAQPASPAVTVTADDVAALPLQGYFVGPVVGSTPLTFAWYSGSPFLQATHFLPSLRAGRYFPKFSAQAQLGLSGDASPGAGYANGTLGLELSASPYFWSSGSNRAYGLGGLGLGTVFSLNPSSSALYPSTHLSLGLGAQHFFTPEYALGGEAGLRTHFVFGSQVEISNTLFVAVTGTWSFGPGTRERPPANPPPGTTSRPTGPVSQPGDPPTQGEDRPPTTFGRSERRCSAYATDGWFEPAQGVWQDDLAFEDKKGKQLTRLGEDEGIVYEAELPMAQRRATLLFGVHHYRRRGELVQVDSRDFIVMKGMSNCTVPVPVKLKFVLRDGGLAEPLWTSPVIGQVPLEGPAQEKYAPWEVRLPARDGVPTEKAFAFETELDYAITASLIRENGAETGMRMSVVGDIKPTAGPKTHFVPVLLSQANAADEGGLILLAETMADISAKRVPDVFPIPPDGLPTSVRVIRNFSDLDIGSKWLEFRRIDATVAALNDTLAASTFLDGAGRVVAVMRGADFRSIFGTGAAGMTVSSSVEPKLNAEDRKRWKSGMSLSWKVLIVPSYESWDTVAHELVHSLPEGWSDSEMKSLCKRNYHNLEDPVAFGHQITEGGQEKRQRHVAKPSLMGPAIGAEKVWMDQCTYFHLTDALAGGPADPPVLMLRAFIGKKGSKVLGELKPIYELMGHADLVAGAGGPYAFVVRDEKGAELGRFPFTPRFRDIETKVERSMVSVVYRVPALSGWSQVELVGPGGVLDRRHVNPEPPALEIVSPADQAQVTPAGGKVRVTWKATAAKDALLLYSVLYSPNGGKDWLDQAFEQKDTAFDVRLDPKGKDPWIKIVATDGTRSAEAIIRISVKSP